ncbi:glucan endo-1,3-beta-glucosidase-like protein 2-like [Hibiscus syriacus]|uniref:ubiquitinyl hydrolase 1 n=1 Tax=Hibiscus syriacus TaxID=106335 RepID=A0A6A2Z126_HIBSY|nr:ubiquitin carboxyl-terminal hydrolase 2-like [Hibiscus syriacus]KAE8685604.1 glucan endo-1,3-beta-glucosidase-like protein 2-like [Hibiscus syriacus]
MGKRVKKNRRIPPKEKKVVAPQSPKVIPQEQKAASTGGADDKIIVVKESKKCSHFENGVDLDKLLTKLRSVDPIRCEDCREGRNDRRGGKGKGKHGKKKGSAPVESKSESKAIWVCLECGHYVCAGLGLPNASTSHAVRHLRQTRHHLVVQWDNPQLRWCFSCSIFIPVEKSEENGESKDVLCEVVKLIKERSSESSSNGVEDVWSGSGSVTCEIKSEGTISNSLDSKRSYVVRGLVNLGNTCFFNSVMQNLLALNRLREYFLNLDVSMGQLTISLKELFAEIKPEMGFKNAINPKPFFASLCAKAPQFRGYQQHDSHELLRCLLDGLYTEELSFRKHTNASKCLVTASQDLTFVDAVFGGQISSTLCCEECGHSSTVFEPFLDLSLSVPTKKSLSKKAQPVTRAKKTKLPPKKAGRTRGKVNKDADQMPSQCVTTPVPNNESPGPGLIAVPKTESVVASSGDSSLSHVLGPSTKADEISSSQNPDVVESQDEQVLESTLKENSGGTADFSWLDYLLTEDTPPENDVGVDDFTWMDYLQQETVADESDLISQNNNISSLLQDSDGKDLVPNEALAESGEVSIVERETNQKPDDSSGNLQEEELPLLVQDSVVLLLPYKEDNHGTESVRENEASSSNTGFGQEVEFDGFGDMFNEPEISEGPIIGPTLANEVAETGFLAGNISDSDPDEVDDSDSPVSVESCLSHFIKPELLLDDNAWNCENCAKILQHQKLKEKKKRTKAGKDLINGSKTQGQYAPSSLDKELQYLNEVRTISNGNINSSGDSLVLHDKSQNGINLENSQTSELNSLVLEDANMLKSNSSVCSKSNAQEQSGGMRPIEHCNVENCRGNANFQQRNSYMTENYQSGESDEEEIYYKNVKVKRNATKRVLINKAPPILTIHLKRFCQDVRGRLSKLNGHVNFRETIDLRPYVDPRCKDADDCIYSLVGVVEHSGTMRGGHYIAYVRGGEKRKGTDIEPVCSQWYYASDRHVRQASIEEVLRCEAYILFYEKI